ncbi:hypothetical protein M408DRAFT_29757, partial [Serendipita vermifera MAFF 305830]
MAEVLKDPSDPRIDAAFGRHSADPNNLDEIRARVQYMRNSYFPVQNVKTDYADGNNRLGMAALGMVEHDRVTSPVGLPSYKPRPAHFGTPFYSHGDDDRAGFLIHEASHYMFQTGDHMEGLDTSHPHFGRNYKIGEYTPTTRLGGGYARVPDPQSQQERMALHGDIMGDPDSFMQGGFHDSHLHSHNMYENADSYRVFASMCARSLFKRALTENDPVGFYLAKRGECKLPSNHGEAKATSATRGKPAGSPKASKSIGSTKSPKSERLAKLAKTIKSARSAKASKSTNNAKAIKGGDTAASRKSGGLARLAKAANDSKGLKAFKGAKSPNALKSQKVNKAGKPVKGATSSKLSTLGRLMKGAKTAKSTSATKGSRGNLGSKPSRLFGATKSLKGSKATKSPNG